MKNYLKYKNIVWKSLIVAVCTFFIAASFSSAVAPLLGAQSKTEGTDQDKIITAIEAMESEDLIYTFTFNEPKLEKVTLDGKTFTRINMPSSFSVGEKPGTPVFQASSVKLLLPQGSEVIGIEVIADAAEIDTFAQGIDLKETHPIIPYQQPVPIGERPLEFVIDHASYQSTCQVPDKMYENVGVGYCRGYPILTLNLFPTKYAPGEGRLFYHPKMTIKVNLEETGYVNRFHRPGNLDDRIWVKSLVCNPEVADTYENPPYGATLYEGGLCDPSDNGGLGYDYVIIVRESLFDFTGTTYNWGDLISRKQADGLEATKIKVEDILACQDYWNDDPLFDDTPARIREFCRDAYQDWGTQYILIAGDNDNYNYNTKIERREMDSNGEDNVETDIYWTHLDNTFNADHDYYWGEEYDNGFDLYSEMYSGSIPCDNKYDVSNWLTKSFFYEDNNDLSYLDNAAFYGGDLGWPCEGDEFIDYSAIKGTDDFLGPIPHDSGPYPDWLGFQFGFETWNSENPGSEYDLSVKWTAEPPNPGWQGGSTYSAINGLRNAINNDQCTLISAVAHADPYSSMDVSYNDWEANYHNTMPFFLYDWGCHCGDMNGADDGILHSMLFHSDTELAFACIYNTGYGWGNFDTTNSSSAVMQKCLWDYMFDIANNSGSTLNWQLGKAHEWARDMMAPTINWGWNGWLSMWRETIQCCLLFGDPAQAIKPPQQNLPPNTPAKPYGPTPVFAGYEHNYSTTTTDPENHQVFYKWDWGDGNISDWLGPYNSFELVFESYAWAEPGNYEVKVKSKDDPNGDDDPSDGLESSWSDPLYVTVSIPGDLNHDGKVDQQDLGILLASYGVDDGGDIDGDGDTDQSDLGILLANWGYGT